eukprot:3409127-Alexandrium_andersonii.AAC.1
MCMRTHAHTRARSYFRTRVIAPRSAHTTDGDGQSIRWGAGCVQPIEIVDRGPPPPLTTTPHTLANGDDGDDDDSGDDDVDGDLC